MAVVTETVVSQSTGDDVAGVAGDTGCDPGNTAVVFALMASGEVCGISSVATAAGG